MNPAVIALIGILAALILIFLAYRFGKNFFRVFGYVLLLFVIINIILGAVVINEALSFRQDFPTQKNFFALEKDGELLAGVVLNPTQKANPVDMQQEAIADATGGFLTYEDIKPYDFPTKSNMEYYNELFTSNEELSFYKTFVFKAEVFRSIEDNIIDLGDVEITLNETLDIIIADDPLGALAKKLGIYKVDIESQLLKETDDIRSVLFMAMLTKIFGEEAQDMTHIIRNLRNGNIEIYPNTFMFKLLKKIPEPLIASMMLEEA